MWALGVGGEEKGLWGKGEGTVRGDGNLRPVGR